MPKTPPPVEWIPTGRAVAQLGIGRRTLFRWIGAGHLIEGQHYRRGLSPKSPVRWDVPAVEHQIERLRSLPDPPVGE
jgi:hypothetical protein